MTSQTFQNHGQQIRLLFVLCVLLAEPAIANEPTGFKTGKALDSALAAKVSWSSVGVPLGDQLRDLQQQAEVVILRDRRIDPHQLITVETKSAARIQVLRKISASIPGGAFCLTEHLACVGPAESIYRLPILLDHNHQQLNSLRRKIDAAGFRQLTDKKAVFWEPLAEPRQILLDQFTRVGARVRNPEVVPHDVWAGGQLPDMTFVDLATIILNQFDLTLEFDSDSPELTIVPIDNTLRLEHRYSVSSKLKSRVVSAWNEKVPGIDIKWMGSTAVVTTTLSQHALLNSILSELQSSDSSAGSSSAVPAGFIRTTNYQLKAERATVGQLIDYFRSQNVPIEVIDEDSAETKALLTQLVQLDTIKESQPGTKFFPLIFGRHFSTVDVQNDRVILSRE